MTPGLAWASLLLRAARRDGLRNAWLWIGPLLVAQQISDVEQRRWVLYIIPLFGLILGNSLNGRGVTPSGARMGESPALLVPVGARARVVGALVAGTVVSGVVSLAAFVTAQVGHEVIDVAWGGPNTYTPDLVRGCVAQQRACWPFSRRSRSPLRLRRGAASRGTKGSC